MSKESINSKQIAGWCFLTGQFLSQFEKNKLNNHYKEVNEKFLNSTITEPKLNQFPYLNPSVVLMICYGLLVYPVEYWKKASKPVYKKIDKFIMLEATNLNPSITSVFDLFIIDSKEAMDTETLLKYLRNAIAHSQINYSFEESTYTFWNIKNGTKNFEATITTINLSAFLTGVGKFFINADMN